MGTPDIEGEELPGQRQRGLRGVYVCMYVCMYKEPWEWDAQEWGRRQEEAVLAPGREGRDLIR